MRNLPYSLSMTCGHIRSPHSCIIRYLRTRLRIVADFPQVFRSPFLIADLSAAFPQLFRNFLICKKYFLRICPQPIRSGSNRPLLQTAEITIPPLGGSKSAAAKQLPRRDHDCLG